MPKQFFTERDIEDMARQGVMTLEVGEDVVLTDLAYERARRLGVSLVAPNQKPPSAPERPYVAKEIRPAAQPVPAPAATGTDLAHDPALKQRIKDAVIARLGGQVDAVLLDTIVERVLGHVSAR